MNMKRYDTERTSRELISKESNIVNNVYSKLPTISAGEYAKVLSQYTDFDGNKAVVPQGWTVSRVPKENFIWGKGRSLVIYRIPEGKRINWRNPDVVENLRRTYDQFEWTPVALLSANATLDGIHFNEKFGRMNYQNEIFSESEYHEPLVGEFLFQKESVEKYNGYYSSCYYISEDKETGKPKSVKGAKICIGMDFATAKEFVSTMVESETGVTAHLRYGAEYDTQVKSLIEAGTVNIYEILKDSTSLGNYYNNKNYLASPVKTGKDGCINNIYGLAGNVLELTQEHYGGRLHRCVSRGGCYYDKGFEDPVIKRTVLYTFVGYEYAGSRATLCIK